MSDRSAQRPFPGAPWLLLAGALILLGGVALPITDGDTALYGRIAKNILTSEEWAFPRYRGGWVVDKPPLTLWLIALSFKAFGFSEAALRLWHILLALGTVASTYFLARLVLPHRKALLASLILLTSIQFFYQSLVPQQDVPLTLFVTLAFFSYLRWAQGWNPSWAILSGLSTALAVLSKGIIGVTIPVMVLGFHLLLDRPPLPRKALAGIASGILTFLAVASPWFVLGAIREGRAFVETFFLGGTLGIGRFFHPVLVSPVKTSWWTGLGAYVPLLLVGILPWTGWLLPALREGVKARREGNPGLWLCTLWVIVIFSFLSLSPGDKVIRYLLPLFPPLAVLLGNVVADARWVKQAAWVSQVAAGSGGAFTLWVLIWSLPGEAGRYLPILFPFLPVFLTGLLLCALAALRARARAGFLLLVVLTLFSYTLLIASVYRCWDRISPWRPLAEIVNRQEMDVTKILILGPHNPFPEYYFDRPVEFVGEEELLRAWGMGPILALIPEDLLLRLPSPPEPAVLARLPDGEVLVRNFPKALDHLGEDGVSLEMSSVIHRSFVWRFSSTERAVPRFGAHQYVTR